jgi:hypothetical protein
MNKKSSMGMQYKAEFLWYSEADICIFLKLSGLLLFLGTKIKFITISYALKMILRPTPELTRIYVGNSISKLQIQVAT